MTQTFIVPSEAEPAIDPTKVRRSKDGRPYIKQSCPNALDQTLDDFVPICRDGRVPSEKKPPPATIQCPACKGKGYVEEIYTRCTTFVSAMEERTQLERWKLRTVLVGVAIDYILMGKLNAADPDDQQMLNEIADEAFEIGDGALKARKGTDLHTLSEYVDQGRPLPDVLTDRETGQERPVTLQDRADMAAWARAIDTMGIVFEDQERFVVNDEFKIGGTYDRLVKFEPGMWHNYPCEWCRSIELPMILDLKTGRVDYGAGKIAQQLAVYAHSDDYDPATGQRTKQDVCQHKGIVIHLPQGTGEAHVLIADLVEGWERVKLSSRVREHRKTEKALLTEFSLNS